MTEDELRRAETATTLRYARLREIALARLADPNADAGKSDIRELLAKADACMTALAILQSREETHH